MATKHEVIALAKKGLHPADVAERLGCGVWYVRKTFARNGLEYERKPNRGPSVSEFWKTNDPKLKKLWGSQSAARIAERLGTTRNAVIGRAHRLGLHHQEAGT